MTRRAAPDERPVALTVAGSDSGGGAGVQADVKTMAAHGAFAASVVTSVTAQNTRGVASAHVLPPEEVRAQWRAVADDFDVRAVKTGMLATAPVVEAVTECLRDVTVPVVVDPVMVAAAGDRLLSADAEAPYEALIADATLVTPNADEAGVLTGVTPDGPESARAAGRELVEMGADAALVTGGHLPGDEVTDVLVTPETTREFVHPRVETAATHGSGCALSSAVAAHLARGEPLDSAVEAGVSFLQRAVRYPHAAGEGPGAVNHLAGLRNRAARADTAEAVERAVARFVAADVSPVVPEVGTNVVGAPPYAERPAETVAVDGRLARTRSGVRPTRGVRAGASSHVARFLLAAREVDPSLRFAANCRYGEAVAAAMADLGWDVASFDRRADPRPDEEGTTMSWGARRALESADRTPRAVVDDGAVGKEPMTRVVARDADALAESVVALAAALRE